MTKNVERAESSCHVIYLFEVTKVCIHRPTDCFQKFKPLFRLNIRKSSYLDRVTKIIKARVSLSQHQVGEFQRSEKDSFLVEQAYQEIYLPNWSELAQM